MKIAVIGAGLSGAAIARQLSTSHQVVVFEKDKQAGGHVQDELVGDTPVSKFGPHIFHTSNDHIWNFVNQYAEFKEIEHRVKAYTSIGWLPWPINLATIEAVYSLPSAQALERMAQDIETEKLTPRPPSFESLALQAVGRPLYDMLLRYYTFKQWQRHPANVPAEIFGRIRVKKTYDENFFDDTHVAEPVGGYTQMVARMLDAPNVSVVYDHPVLPATLTTLLLSFDKVICTAPPDVITKYRFGKLDYLKVNFGALNHHDPVTKAIVESWPTAVVNFNTKDIPFTRGTAYHRLNQTTTQQYIIEKPGEGEELYPVRSSENLALHRQYKAHLESANVILAGRLGGFEYLDMHVALEKSLQLAEEFG